MGRRATVGDARQVRDRSDRAIGSAMGPPPSGAAVGEGARPWGLGKRKGKGKAKGRGMGGRGRGGGERELRPRGGENKEWGEK